MFTAQDVVELRKLTGAGMMDCKKALTECNGNMEDAKDFLRKKGVSAVAKKAGRIAAEGMIGSYIHMGGKIGVLIEVNSETDFVAKNEKFQELVKDLAMHIAASKPEVVNTEDLSEEMVNRERAIYKEQALAEGKPANIVDKMIEGRVKKYYKEVVLMEQPFIKDPDKTIRDVMNDATLIIGEKLVIRRFTRYELGEGLEKRQDNFAEEVMSQVKN
ncbi:MAG: translation elongation factor Ts [Spirochaetales bacterium]